MNAAQMLAAAGEPNTTAGRANFHKRFKDKQAFDAWYNSKKQYGGGLTDGIAFPQQPDASSRRVPYYDKGGIFAPNVMPWNGPVGFYEHGGMTNEIAFPQQPTEHINFSAFPWKPKYDMGGLPGGSNDMPCLECGGNMAYGGYMKPGGPVGYKLPPDPDTYFAAQDAAINYPAQGTNIHYDYSKVTDPNTALLNNYTVDELNMMGANIPVANPVEKARFKKINDYNKEHPIIPAGGGLFKYSSPKSGKEGERLQYVNGKYQLYTPPLNPVVVNKRYGGYMQTGGTTQMDQGQYTNTMAQKYVESLADFSRTAQPMPMGNVQEAGYGAYGTEVNYNQMEDFNNLDMNAVDQMSSMQNRLDDLKNKQTSIFDLGRNLTNIGSSIYQKPMSYKTKTVGSGYARYGGNMFKNGGLKKYAPGASVPGYTDEEVAASDDWFAKQVAESAANEAKNNYYKQISGTNQGTTAGNTAGTTTNTNVGNTNDNTMGDTRMTADELAYFRGMMRGSNQGNYAPSWQAQQQQALANQYLGDLFKNTSLTGFKYRHGPLVQKGKMSFRTYYDPKTGKTVTAPGNQTAASGQPGADKQMQKGPKGAGFIKNLIAKNKQRKAGKQATKDQALDQQFANSRIAQATPGTTDLVDYFGQDFENNNRLSPGMQAELSKGQRMPLTGAERKKQFFDNRLDQDTDRPSPAPQSFIPYYPGSEPIGFAYGGFPQYGYGGYSEYEEGAEVDMSPEEIENYLAMGGTLEYLD
jgi:hypothetical protein